MADMFTKCLAATVRRRLFDEIDAIATQIVNQSEIITILKCLKLTSSEVKLSVGVSQVSALALLYLETISKIELAINKYGKL